MIAEELINHMIPPLKLGDTASKAIVWMEELRVRQLPVVDKGVFLGLISEEIILEKNEPNLPISAYELMGKACFVNKYQHFYDILKIASDNEVQVIGVLEDDETYFGVITVEDIIASLSQTAAVQTPGGIIVLSLGSSDYSMAEIGRLVEENGSKILSSSIREDPLDPSKLKLTIKINNTDLKHIIATLERFGYKIIAKFEEQVGKDDSIENLEVLMKYLNI
jgi:CBS domain-containing protein